MNPNLQGLGKLKRTVRELLRQIQDSAVAADMPINTILRQCLVLAARLGSHEFEEWVKCELDGYSSADLPAYRIFHVESRGHFSGVLGSGLRNAVLPLSNVPEEYRKAIGCCYCGLRAAYYESVAQEPRDTSLACEPWPADLIKLLHKDFYQNCVLVDAWKVVPVAQLKGIVDSVRNRILVFTLTLEKDLGNGAAEEGDLHGEVAPDVVQRALNTTIFTHTIGHLNIAGGDVTVGQQIVSQGDFNALGEVVRELGGTETDVQSLREALDHDDYQTSSKGLGPRTLEWLGKMAERAGNGLLLASAQEVGTRFIRALLQYIGLP